MARGYIYEISDDLDKFSVNCMDESDFYEDLGSLCIDFVRDVEAETAENYVCEFLKRIGADWTLENEDVCEDGAVYSFVMSDSLKRAFFIQRFETAQELIEEMTLDEFACEDPYKLRSVIYDDYGDVVYYNGCLYNLDAFIRSAIPGKRYYVGTRVVFMH
jgi:hypothetical protein